MWAGLISTKNRYKLDSFQQLRSAKFEITSPFLDEHCPEMNDQIQSKIRITTKFAIV